jgi:hypothetical protein
MAKPPHIYMGDMYDRIERELYKQGISKEELARRCGFGRKVLQEKGSMYLPYFMKVCATLHVSADYLLFGKEMK